MCQAPLLPHISPLLPGAVRVSRGNPMHCECGIILIGDLVLLRAEGQRIVGKVTTLLQVELEDQSVVFIVVVDKYQLTELYKACTSQPQTQLFESSLVRDLLTYITLPGDIVQFCQTASDVVFA